ncbi:ATP synthase F0 subunit B [bacterium]|nr:ATP synthase F0 subunit B [bacterium]
MEIFPNWTFIPVVTLLLILVFALNRLFFRPIGRILDERHKRIEGAQLEAEQIRAASQGRLEEFDRKMREARRESDEHMARITAEAMQERQHIISGKKSEVEKMLGEARTDIQKRTEEARAKLLALRDKFAILIASRILKRPVSDKTKTS